MKSMSDLIEERWGKYKYKSGNLELLKLKEEIFEIRKRCARKYEIGFVDPYEGLEGMNKKELKAQLERTKDWERWLEYDSGPGWAG